VKGFLVVEMNTGQMLEDVRLSVCGRAPVEFYGRPGGVVPFPDEILAEIRRMASAEPHMEANPRQAWFERMTSLN
jgi:2-oxoglutarate ferredoxin oxidoreductase subunit alpha